MSPIRTHSSTTAPLLGVVIPALDEAETLPSLFRDLADLPVPHRVVVADGGSADGTRTVARNAGALVVEAPRGRARQLNAGARLLGTPWLLFLHADSRIPSRTGEALARFLEQARPEEAAHFAFALQGSHWFWRFIEMGQGLRERFAGLVYGDQGLLVHRALFREVGGYPELPLMEDVEMISRLRTVARVRKIPAPLLTSPRRYRESGRWRSWVRNTLLISLYKAGVSPGRLVRFYPSRTARRDRMLLVFAKEPLPGRVKTRLASDLGPERAAAIYRDMGRRIVDQVRGGPYRIRVCFDPPRARKAMRAWLGKEVVEYRPQHAGDLGARMEAAFREAFSRARRVVIVGTDAPDVDRHRVEAAFRLLDNAEVVLGPARDGGYYLLGLRRPVPELFRDMPWSTDRVLEITRERVRTLGLREALLSPLSDVDTLEDLEDLEDY